MECTEDGVPASVEVKFANGKSVVIPGAGKSVWDLYDDMLEHTAELEFKEEMVEMDKN